MTVKTCKYRVTQQGEKFIIEYTYDDGRNWSEFSNSSNTLEEALKIIKMFKAESLAFTKKVVWSECV